MPPRLRALGTIVPTLDTRVAQPPPKTVDPFYTSPEYRRWQQIVVGRAAGRCQDPECKTPQRTGMRLFADHVQERRDRPDLELDPTNGLARCGSCHTRKTNAARAARMAAPT